nr:T9SS type A sorting domain-containing protein [Bacteroidota bacterium]
MEADSAQIMQFATIAVNGHGNASVYARNILLALEQIEYNEPVILPDQMKSLEAYEEFLDLMDTKPPMKIEVYPNPSDEYVIISYSLEMKRSEHTIRISDIHGNSIKSIVTNESKNQILIDTSNWIPGVYIVTLETNGKIIGSTKFTIIK